MDNLLYRVLLVEDNEDDYLIVRDLLRDITTTAYDLQWVPTYEAARQVLTCDQYDVCLLDYRLGAATGVDLVREFASGTAPFILLTGNEDYEVDVEAAKAGAADYLLKGHINALLLERAIRYAIERKRAEQKVLATEVRYRRLFESAHDGILILDAATCKITDVNPYLMELLEYSREELLGKELWEIGLLEDAQASNAAFRVLEERGYMRYDDLPLETKAGERREVEFVSNVYGENGHRVIQCNIRDITERNRAKRVEHESQRFLQATLDALSSHIAVLDETGEIVAVNKAWQQFAQENGGSARRCEVGANYIEVCERVVGERIDEGLKVACGIREVMAGQHEAFCLEYPCHSPGEKCWFNVCVTRFVGEGPVRVVVAHENITASKLAEIKLLRSEARFRTAITEAPLPLIIHREDGQVLQISKGWTQYSGYTIEDIPTIHDWVERAYGKSSVQAQEYIDELYQITEPRDEGEWTVNAKNGKPRIWDFRSTPLGTFGDHNHVVISAAIDVTERKQAEEKLRASQANLAMAQQVAHMGSWEIDVADLDDMSKNALHWSDEVFRIFGYQPGQIEVSIENFLCAVHPDDRELIASAMSQALHENKLYSLDHRIILPDGEHRVVHEQAKIVFDEQTGTPLKVVGAVQDITEQKQAETRLREREEFQRVLLGNLPNGSISVFDRDLRYILAAGRNWEMLGIAPEQVIGKTPEETFISDQASRAMSYYRRVLDGESVEFELIHGGRFYNISATPIYDQEDNVVNVLAVSQNITERKQAEVALVQAEERYRSIFENAVQGIFQSDAQGHYLSANFALAKMYGYDSPDTLMNELTDISQHLYVEPERREEFTRLMARHDRVSKFESPVRCTDGTVIWISEEARTVRDECGELMYYEGTVEDITVRKQAENALRYSEEKYRSLALATSQIVWSTPADGMVEDMPAWRAYTGQSVEEVRGWGWTTALHPDDLEATCNTWLHCVAAKCHYETEYRIRAANGRYRLFAVRGVPVLRSDGSIREWVGTCADIQDRRVAEEERDRFFTLSLDMLAIISSDGYIKRLNPAFGATLGFSNEEMMTVPFLDFVHPDDHAATLAEQKKLEAGAKVMLFENRYRCRDGSYKWLRWTCAPSGDLWYCVAHDITSIKKSAAALHKANDELEAHVMERTAELGAANDMLHAELTERRRTEEALREAQQMLELVMNQIPQAIFWKDRHCLFLGCNYRLAADAGFNSPEEVKGKSDFDLPWAEYAADYQADDQLVMETNTPKFNIEEHSYQANGKVVWLRTNKIPLHDSENQVVGVLCSYEDITEQKRAVAAIQEARREADAANLAKSEFLSRMSHELRTPLNAILGFGQILNKEALTPLAKESVDYIIRGGRHLLGLVNEILDIASVEAGRLELSLEVIALNDVVPEACALVRPLAAERNILINESSGAWHGNYILADRQRLKQVLINLISNAIKYNREDGEVEISCDQKPDGCISVAVRDTGLGIAPHDLSKLFTPFERLNAATAQIEGTGLGLVLSQRMITAMGGVLRVESVVGQGTTFIFELPQADPPEEQLASLSKVAPDAGANWSAEHTYSVLCIEDNPSNLRLMEAIFQDRPEITLLSAIQGSIGLEMARQHEPDLILLDLNLPDIHGKDVLTRLQQSAITRDIPVVIVSADATSGQVERLLSAGAKDYLTKPLNVNQFLLTVDKLLRTTPEPDTESSTGNAAG